MIENLILNAEDGDNVGGLRYCEAAAAQRIAWENGRGVRIEVEDRSKGTYRAVVVFLGGAKMAHTQQSRTNATPGFAIRIKDDTEIGGILMQELVVPGYPFPYNRPVAAVVSVNEAREIAASRKNTEPCTYRLWARGVEGEYIPVPAEIWTNV